ncbi:MAG: hypothetical protein LBQ91_03820, partial [Oscillospiraceae bacterium]|nr:hypothetical protein [Oscillospiraceae bacterium]
GELLDFHGGLADLSARVIRTVGDPARRFSEDALRLLRAVRFCAQLGFSLEEKTREAVIACADGASAVSSSRVYEEFSKYLAAKIKIEGRAETVSSLSDKSRRDARICALARAFGIPVPQLSRAMGLSARRLSAADSLFAQDSD